MKNDKNESACGFSVGILTAVIVLLILVGSGLFIKMSTQYERAIAECEQQALLTNTRSYWNELEIDFLKEENSSLQKERVEQDAILAESFSKVELFAVVKDIGLTELLTPGEIRDMLELLDSAPYGSPFASGHWITSHYGKRDESAINGDGWTDGVDLVGKNGDVTVRTLADGVIVDMGTSEVFGLYVVVQHGDTFRTQYSHLNKVFWQNLETHDVVGEHVNKGDKLGIMGNTGVCWSDVGGDGSHVDLRMTVKGEDTDGNPIWLPIDPEIIIQRIGGEVK